MKNGDLPAMPVSTSESICQMTGTLKPEFAGLTKREMFAMTAMQGILSNHGLIDDACKSSLEWVAKRAASAADLLLAELERE